MAQFGRSAIAMVGLTRLLSVVKQCIDFLYHMAKSTGTFWAHPSAADGAGGKCSSHNHIMQAGSVGEAISELQVSALASFGELCLMAERRKAPALSPNSLAD